MNLTNSENLFLISRVIKEQPPCCKERNVTCHCVGVAAIKQMEKLGLLNEEGMEIVKWLN